MINILFCLSAESYGAAEVARKQPVVDLQAIYAAAGELSTNDLQKLLWMPPPRMPLLKDMLPSCEYELTPAWVRAFFDDEMLNVAKSATNQVLSIDARIELHKRLAALDVLAVKHRANNGIMDYFLGRSAEKDATILDALMMEFHFRSTTVSMPAEKWALLFAGKNPVFRMIAIRHVGYWGERSKIRRGIENALRDDFYYVRRLALEVLSNASLETNETIEILDAFLNREEASDSSNPNMVRAKEVLMEKAKDLREKFSEQRGAELPELHPQR